MKLLLAFIAACALLVVAFAFLVSGSPEPGPAAPRKAAPGASGFEGGEIATLIGLRPPEPADHAPAWRPPGEKGANVAPRPAPPDATGGAASMAGGIPPATEPLATGNAPAASTDAAAPMRSTKGAASPNSDPPPAPAEALQARADAAPQFPSEERAPDPGERERASPVQWTEADDARDTRRRLAAAASVLELDPFHRLALRDAAAAAGQLEQWDEARGWLGRLVALQPEDVALRFDYAAVLLRTARYLDAISNLQIVLDVEPENAQAWFNLAVARQKLGALRAARHAWDRAVELLPAGSEGWLEGRFHRGEIALELEAWSAAESDFDAVVTRRPRDDAALVNLSLARWKLRRPEEARQLLEQLLERQPRHVPAINRLAEYAWDEHRATQSAAFRDEALRRLRLSLSIDAAQPEVRALLQQVEAAGGDD